MYSHFYECSFKPESQTFWFFIFDRNVVRWLLECTESREVMKKTYAVVDIETTGTDPKHDRIIQFGCVLIEDDAIVSRLSIDINPDRQIPNQIRTLTGITNQRVKEAPYFEDVALTIYNLLADTVFVAHNIYFDYPFLNSELKRCGMPELDIPGIDTVELAQIFLPTSLSFRLGYLAEELELVHENPHQADSDAEVTAQLLLKLKAKMKSLPLVTLEAIEAQSEHLAFQTRSFITEVLEEVRAEPETLADDLQIVNGLALQKKTVALFEENYYQPAYPRAKKNKVKLYQAKLTFRKEQARLMNLVYDFFQQTETKDLLIEAATGIGKTLGYLLPACFFATPEKPVVVSTASLLLQEQIMTHDLPLLNELMEQPLQGVVLKSSRHYINLARFYQTLQQSSEQKQYAFYQMAVLVWLTETKTGDFDELNQTNYNHPFWQDVCHYGSQTLVASDPFYEVDFIHYRDQCLRQSNLIVTNHAFLAQEDERAFPELPDTPYLIIDEAHHLNQTLSRQSTKVVDVATFQKLVHQLNEKEWFEQWQQLAQKDQHSQHALQLLQDIMTELAEDLTDFYHEVQQLITEEDRILTKERFDQLTGSGEELLVRIEALYQDGVVLSEQLRAYFYQHQAGFSLVEQDQQAQFLRTTDRLKADQQAFQEFTEDFAAHYVHFVEPKKMRFGLQDLQADCLPETKWYQRFERILYLGGTLKIGRQRDYFQKRWGIDAKLKVIQSPYDYGKQARLYVPSDSLDIQHAPAEHYAHYLAEAICKLAGYEQRPILVLFTSHDILQRVYQKVRGPMLQEGRELLAQGVGGSRERLLKRFLLSKDGILFGADSFWEGIDLPGEILQLLIVTRLPFENPKRPLVQARNAYLEEQGLNPFYQEALPHTALRLRQALGRLIRGEEDKGVMILLDARFLNASYANQLQKALPKELPIEAKPLDEILSAASEFLQIPQTSDNS